MTERRELKRTRPEPLGARLWIGLLVLTLSTFIVVLDSTVVVIALPEILQDLNGSLDVGAWILAGFILAFAVFLLPFGKLSDIVGRRRLCIAGVTVFTIASIACAVSPTVEVLIASRVIQGVGAAMVEPTVLALIKSTFPAERLGLAFGVQGVAAGVAASLGPSLGGLITTAGSWEGIFLINVPVGIIAVVGIALTVKETRNPEADRSLDIPGTLLSAAAIFAIVFAIIEGEKLGWGSPVIIGCFAAGAALVFAFIVVERTARHPLVDLRLFSDRLYSVGNILRAIVEFATLGVFFPLTLFLQIQLGYTSLETALVLLPLVVGSFITSPLAGSLSDRVDVRFVVIPGLIAVATSIFWLARLSPDTQWFSLLAPIGLLGLGLGSLYGTTTSATLRNVPPTQTGIASGISYTAFLLGSELGIAIVSAVLQSQLLANLRTATAGTGLTDSDIDELASQLSTAPGTDQSGTAFPTEFQTAFETAFADAVNTALFACVIAAALGAVIAAFFSNRKNFIPTPEIEKDQVK